MYTSVTAKAVRQSRASLRPRLAFLPTRSQRLIHAIPARRCDEDVEDLRSDVWPILNPPLLVLKVELGDGEDKRRPPDGGAPADAHALVEGKHEDGGVSKRAQNEKDLPADVRDCPRQGSNGE